MKPLGGQRVLLVAPRFFGYELDIHNELQRQGAHVDWLPDRPFDTPLMVAMTRFQPGLILPSADRLYRRMLASFGATHYDAILIVNGQTLSPTLRTEIRRSFPTARMVLYMWDSLRNRPGMKDDLALFDATFSFDPVDAAEFGMRLRPLFFNSRFEMPPSESFKYHLSFVGTAHTDRYAVIERLRSTLPSGLSAFWYLYLQAPWVYHAYRMTNSSMRRAPRDAFQFKPMSKADVSAVFAASHAILDIEHPQQRGLTIRTLETFGAHKKLISTNAHVREYDFFHPQNICVIDRRAPQVPAGFLESPLVLPSPALYRRYSLAGWMHEVMDAHSPVTAAPGAAEVAVPAELTP